MNTATAEQSAAASEELSSQSLLLKDMIGRFSLKRQDGYVTAAPSHSAPPPKQITKPKKSMKNINISLDDAEFGKY